MDFTYINDNNIKVSITKNELEVCGVDADSIDYKTPCSRRFVRKILDEAYEKTGFDADGGAIYVRVFLSADGGCELFITKKEPTVKVEEGDFNYGFAVKAFDTDSLIDLCKRLKASGYRGGSELFFEKESFILRCDAKPKLPSYISVAELKKKECCDFSFACEYGKYITLTEEISAYLFEHCECVCSERAVEKLAF